MSDKRYDPVTFDIIQNALQAVADEMFVAQRKTSMSAIIYEVLDLSSGICDRNGEIAASGAGIPTFIGVTLMGFALIHAVPGGPVEVRTGEHGISPVRLAYYRHELGLDQPPR